MPVLLVLIIGISVYTLTLDGAGEGLKYYFLPDFNGFTAAAEPEAMRDEILRIFARGDAKQIGLNAQETIPLSWEKLIPMVLDRYQKVIERYGRTR